MSSVGWQRSLQQKLWPSRVQRPSDGRKSSGTGAQVYQKCCRVSLACSAPSEVVEADRKLVSKSSGGSMHQPRVEQVKGRSSGKRTTRKPREMSRDEKLDAFGRLRTPRAAREMALCILYAATLRDVPPLRVYEERLHQRIGRDFNREILEMYEHEPVDVGDNDTEEDESKAIMIMQQQEQEADLEGTVLTAPLPLVYTRFALNFSKNILRATSERWKQQEIRILELFPPKWKKDRNTATIPFCILQMAIAEIETFETSSKVVINEAIDLTKRFCDGGAPRIVHGILGKYMLTRDEVATKDRSELSTQASELRHGNNEPMVDISKFTYRQQPTAVPSQPGGSEVLVHSSRDGQEQEHSQVVENL